MGMRPNGSIRATTVELAILSTRYALTLRRLILETLNDR
jgi:hypothetical protein